MKISCKPDGYLKNNLWCIGGILLVSTWGLAVFTDKPLQTAILGFLGLVLLLPNSMILRLKKFSVGNEGMAAEFADAQPIASGSEEQMAAVSNDAELELPELFIETKGIPVVRMGKNGTPLGLLSTDRFEAATSYKLADGSLIKVKVPLQFTKGK
ncbi:hypothetical protein [Zhongshania sp. BJYM1]|uniref:hypothetical protein n=1 Tax=Zhongshania aquatica TaxID=2965069 RepID=UPI0022B45E62|nr:hypothetical protein [Marortus sp. BJYM1]